MGKYCERIYSESEIKLIEEIFDMFIKQIYDEDLDKLLFECKEMFLEYQKTLKEIERLKEELKYTIPIVEHNKTITKHLKEKERLNDIINELEKLLKEEKTRTRYANDVERFTAYDFALKRLQELKGSDKE